MIKPFVILTLLCAPAAADSTTTYVVELAGKSNKHVLLVAEKSCGQVQIKSPRKESFLRVCAMPAASGGKQVRLDVERRTRDEAEEQHQSAVLIASVGSSYDLLDGKLTVKTH